jgi:hypothetical protein
MRVLGPGHPTSEHLVYSHIRGNYKKMRRCMLYWNQIGTRDIGEHEMGVANGAARDLNG